MFPLHLTIGSRRQTQLSKNTIKMKCSILHWLLVSCLSILQHKGRKKALSVLNEAEGTGSNTIIRTYSDNYCDNDDYLNDDDHKD